MTRYEKFIESINTPEKMVETILEQRALFDVILEVFCYDDCNDVGGYIVENCDEFWLKYLNEEID